MTKKTINYASGTKLISHGAMRTCRIAAIRRIMPLSPNTSSTPHHASPAQAARTEHAPLDTEAWRITVVL
jgi:hypothetical protein